MQLLIKSLRWIGRVWFRRRLRKTPAEKALDRQATAKVWREFAERYSDSMCHYSMWFGPR